MRNKVLVRYNAFAAVDRFCDAGNERGVGLRQTWAEQMAPYLQFRQEAITD